MSNPYLFRCRLISNGPLQPRLYADVLDDELVELFICLHGRAFGGIRSRNSCMASKTWEDLSGCWGMAMSCCCETYILLACPLAPDAQHALAPPFPFAF